MKNSLLFILCTAFLALSAITWDVIPQDKQLFSRDDQDSGTVIFSGTFTGSSVDIVMFKDGVELETLSASTSPFNITPKIHAEFANYKFEISEDGSLDNTVDSIVCGDFYLISGQSNAVALGGNSFATMHTFARVYGENTSSVLTADWFTDSTWRVAYGFTWVYGGYGPLGGFAYSTMRTLANITRIPVAAINWSRSGSAIDSHQKLYTGGWEGTLNYYGKMLSVANKTGLKNKVKGIIWYQGESSGSGSGYRVYEEQFDSLYTSWKEDYPTVEKAFVVQVHTGCSGDSLFMVREVQRQLGIKNSDIEVATTMGVPGHDGCHYNWDGYDSIGTWLGRQIAGSLYGHDSANIVPPNLEQAYFSNVSQNEITLVFNIPVVWPADYNGHAMVDYFYLDDTNVSVTSGVADGNNIVLTLSGASAATKITYLPNANYNNTDTNYEGPYVTNLRGMGALSFAMVPIATGPVAMEQEVLDDADFSLSVSPNPFNPTTEIMLVTRNTRHVTRKNIKAQIYSSSGKLIENLVSNRVTNNYSKQNGHGSRVTFTWNASSSPSGIYIIKAAIGKKILTKKITLLR